MQIKIMGKGINIGESLETFTKEGVSNLIDKYIGFVTEATVFIGKDNRLFSVEAMIQVSKGLVLKTDGMSEDPYKAVSLAITRLEERLKKHKHRIINKDRRQNWETGGYSATNYVLERRETPGDEDEEHLVIAEQNRYVMSLTVSEAVMKLDLMDVPVVMFKNADSGRINVVYKRQDGHIGWIDYKE